MSVKVIKPSSSNKIIQHWPIVVLDFLVENRKLMHQRTNNDFNWDYVL
jgi:hypothetical protein